MDKKNSCVQVYENIEASVGCTKLILTHHYLNLTATREPYRETSAGLITGKKYKTAKVRIQMFSVQSGFNLNLLSSVHNH